MGSPLPKSPTGADWHQRSALWCADPAAAAVVDPCRLASVHREAPDQVEERLVALGEVRHLGGPHVHLGIDVDRPVAAPGGAHLVVPDPLEIGGLAARPGAGDQEVAAVLEVERHQPRIVGPELPHALVGGQPPRLVGRRSQVQRHAVEQALMVGDVILQEGLVRLPRGAGESLRGDRRRGPCRRGRGTCRSR